jgi:hypothetical protein
LEAQRHELASGLSAMAGLKQNTGFPMMAVSKFLHFYNPNLFPIYDREIIEGLVLVRFKSDYRLHQSNSGLSAREETPEALLCYYSWAAALMASAHPGFMQTFVDWLSQELPPRKFGGLGSNVLRQLCATAFEFTVIGAEYIDNPVRAAKSRWWKI